MTGAVYEFPSSYSDSFLYWWRTSRNSAAKAERALIERGLAEDKIPVISSDEAATFAGKCAVIRDTPLKAAAHDKRWSIHSLEIGTNTVSPDETMNIVVCHGYGNGLGFLWQNMAAISALPNSRTHFIDWLGMGRSGRPPFPSIKQKDNTRSAMIERVKKAEAFFVDSLEEYRQAHKLEKMVLMGHSIGGYLSAAYAFRYPQHVQRLIMISPAGVPKSPYRETYKEEDVETQAKKHFEQQKQTAQALQEEFIPASSASQENLPEAPKSWWTHLWESGVSPFSIIRGSTFLGPSLLSRYANRRFKAFPPDVQQDLFTYLYSISKDRGSGEYVFSHVLAPGAHGRWPLVTRLGVLNCPITFIYGDNDWMDKNGGIDVVKILRDKPDSPETALQKQHSKTMINQHSGHWVFLENPGDFNTMIRKELAEAYKVHQQH